MTAHAFRKSNIAIFIMVGLAILGALLGMSWLHWIGKPLATLLILFLALEANPQFSSRYKKWVCIGLFLDMVGDVLLMLPGDFFIEGLVAFLFGHFCYIVAFLPGASRNARIVAIAGYALVAAANLVCLLPKLPRTLVVPVLAYIAVLALMAAIAAARAWTLRADAGLARQARLAAIGGFLFVCSDGLLAWDRFGFAGGMTLAPLWILASYYTAQWLVARSVQRD